MQWSPDNVMLLFVTNIACDLNQASMMFTFGTKQKIILVSHLYGTL